MSHAPAARLAAVLALPLLAGCVSATQVAQDPEPSPAPTGSSAPAAVSLVVSSSTRPGKGFYIEGAVPLFELHDSAGTPVAGSSDDTGATYSDLPAGTYELYAAQQPCDGNCGYLDPPTDDCTVSLTLSADTSVSVVFRVGHPCRATVRPAG
ncbi:MAG: hypothetical protein R2731_18075 [Nocardioides sp.]